MEDLEEVSAPKDLSQIVKGKRTKRQRPLSPIPFTIATPSPSSAYGDHCNTNNNNSAANSSEEDFLGSMTEEDEDMANCLILLAQSHHFREPSSNKFDQYHQDSAAGADKFTSKRYIETPLSGNGKAGMYVYQCKTCGRTFPSFQALGGHRASHKKPKNMSAEEKKMSLALSDDEEESFKINNYRNRKPSALSLELGNRGLYSSYNSEVTNKSPAPKVHECSYCGAEFTSGQALGGHMRRHRGAPAPASTNTTLSLSPISPVSMISPGSTISPGSINQDSDIDAEAKNPRHSLSLDLNLPAPEDDQGRDSKFALVPKQEQQQQQHQHHQQQQQQQQQQQPALVLSTRRLIECQY